MSILNFFFEKFIQYGSEEFYDKNILILANEEHLKDNCSEYTRAGFAGGCASVNAANIVCEKVFWNQRQSHLGYK